MRYVLTIALALFTASFATADDIPISGDKRVPQYSYAELSVKVETGDKTSWSILPVPIKKSDRGDGFLQFSGMPGVVYSVSVTVVNFKAERLNNGSTNVAFDGGMNPVPPPQPIPPQPIPPTPQPIPPTPQPVPPIPVPPVPLANAIYLIVVEESSERTVPVAKVLGDTQFWNSLPAVKGWRHYDKDQPEAKQKLYVQYADAYIEAQRKGGVTATYPVLLVLNETGTLIESNSLPDTTGIRTLVQRVTGK